MNGAQDIGGMQSFGPVEREEDEPVFHAEWERRAFALTLAMGATGAWTLDGSRLARESLPPAQYYASSYYQIWLAALENLIAQHGLASREEMAAGRAMQPAKDVKRVLAASEVDRALAAGGPTRRETGAKPRFRPGDRVRARNINPRGHTRLPRYVRGHEGEIVMAHGPHVFPDTNAVGGGEQPQHLYTVRFAGRELWGGDGHSRDHVHADLWESYLEPA